MFEDKTLNSEILIEQVKTLYQSMFPLLLINLVVGTFLVYGLWDVISHTKLILWMGLMLVMLCLRAIIYANYRSNFEPKHIKRYSNFLTIGSAAAGVIWGLAGILLFAPDRLDYQLFLIIFLFGMTVSSTFTLSIYLPVYFAFSPTVILPIALYFLIIGGSMHLALGLVSIFYLIALSTFNIKLNRSFKQSLQMRYENLDLIEQLHAKRIEADRANNAKSKFLAAASHDLRQPLYVLSLYTTILDELATEPKINNVVNKINLSVAALKSLFDALLDISQLDAGVMKVENCDFLLNNLISKLKNDFDPIAEEKKLTINWGTCHHTLHSDPNLLEQIIRNYLSNAIRYTDRGEIGVDFFEKNKTLTIRVTDTGYGIEEENQKNIFDEFYQIGNPERDRNKGLGLGLSIVKRTASLLNHKIDLESELGKGSAFSITVELADRPLLDKQENEALKEVISQKQSPLVVVIDDEKSIREGLRELLEMWDFDAIISADGANALKSLKESKRIPDAIISDFRLRNNETALDAIDSIHHAFNDEIPVLIITGDIEKDRLIELNSRKFEVLHKPVPPLKLRTFLRNTTKKKTIYPEQ